MIQNRTLIVDDPIFTQHKTGLGHPEQPKRTESILNALSTLKLKSIRASKATIEQIQYCHTKTYIDLVKKEAQAGKANLSTGDTPLSKNSFNIALYSAGSVLTAIDQVMTGVSQNVFCNCRPPGHHACKEAGMGFCFFNNVAIGARYLQKKFKLNRVLIVDWDVHHGNGTQDIFERDPSVFYFSTHQEGIYPNTGSSLETGTGPGKGTLLNCPIKSSSSSCKKVIKAFQNKLIPAMKQFKPEFVFISCGFDAHKDDPLGGFNLTERDFSDLTKIVKHIAEKYANGRLVSVLEGGYNLKAISRSAVAHVRALSED